MKKQIISLGIIAALLLSLGGCKGNKNSSSDISTLIPSLEVESIVEKPKYEINPLTGVENLKKSSLKAKPVAIMINNAQPAQSVQSSLAKADIIYETYVEGGITRLLAVYKDIKSVGDDNIGSLRSGRYSYVDLALGHGAQFVHAGLDEDYCSPHIREVGTTTYDLNTNATYSNTIGGNAYAFRTQNGLSYEHTLYTTGKQLYKGLKANFDMTLDKPQDMWMKFVSEDKKYVPDGGECLNLYVPFSGSTYSAQFKFNSETNRYDKFRAGAYQKDYNSNKQVTVDNILVLYSSVYYFPDGKHVQTDLSSGSGYYVSNGGYREIKWSKGSASSSFKITDNEGKEIDYNPGKTYVCLTNHSNKGATTFN